MELKYIVYITNGKFYIGVHKTNPEVFDNYIGLGIYRQSNATGDCVAKYSELQTSQISRVLKGVIKSHKGYVFKYKNEDIV